MIHLVLGKQGSGKTLYCVSECKKYYEKGFKIYSNVHLKFPYEKINYMDIINCKYEKAVILIDEAHQLLSSRNSMSSVSRQICDSFLSMLRKKKIILYVTTQTSRKIDVRIRDEVSYVYVCSKFVYVNKTWIEYYQDLNKKVPCILSITKIDMFSQNESRISLIANPYYKYYDTHEIILIEGLEDANKQHKRHKSKSD